MWENLTLTKMAAYVEYQVPFCKPFFCSFASSNQMTNNTNHVLWDCVPENCKVNVLIFLGIIIILATMTIAFNCLILGINLASKTRRMRKRNPTMSNYSVYVVSLAVADLLVGVVVLPLCIFNFYLEFMVDELSYANKVKTMFFYGTQAWRESGQDPQGRIAEISGDVTTGSTTSTPDVVTIVHAQPMAAHIVRGALGVFTHLTLFVSIYTLITASADRFYAATYPTRFNSSQIKRTTDQTKNSCLPHAMLSVRRSTIAVCVVWVAAIIFAVVPIALSDHLYFRHVGHIFAAMTSDKQYSSAVRWYLTTLVIPLIGMWLLNVMICFTLWRRKRQLGLRRRQSLRRNHSSGKRSKPPPSSPSNSDSVFEHCPAEGQVVPKYPASRWNQNDSTDEAEVRPQFSTFHALYRHKPNDASMGTPKSPASFHSQSIQYESRGSLIRKKFSSIKQAKDRVLKQSYEANITKTLCIVVIAFTMAVLPLVVSLSNISVGEESTKEILNNEVSALACSLLLLFSNSFVNCVIYGARMRDFRTTLCQLLRTFVDKIKNILCCCCSESTDSFSSEVVGGVFLFTKQQKPEMFPRSPQLRSTNSAGSFRLFSRNPPNNSRSREATLNSEAIRDGAETPNVHCKNFFPVNCDGVAVYENKNTRPSSSGYRTDPERLSSQEDAEKKRSSQRCEKQDEKDFAGKESANTFTTATESPVKPRESSSIPTALAKTESKNERSQLTCPDMNRHDREQTEDEISEFNHAETQLILHQDDNTELLHSSGEFNIVIDDADDSRESELKELTDFTMDIDFSMLSATEKNT